MTQPTRQLFSEHPWQIIEETYRPDKNKVAESIFSLSNENIGTRGLFEEGLSENTLEGCYIAGLYFREKTTFEWKRVAFPSFMNSMAHTANWLKIRVEVDGESFGMGSSTVAKYRRVLDMKTAVLARDLVFVTKSGAQTQLRWERFISLADRHLAVQRLSIKALAHNKPVRVSFEIDGTKGNQTEVTKTGVHSDELFRSATENELALVMKIRSTAQYAIHRMRVRHDIPASAQSDFFEKEKVVGQSIVFTPEPDREVHLEKLVSIWTSRDAGHPHGLIPKSDPDRVVREEQEAGILSFLRTRSGEHLKGRVGESYDVLYSAHAGAMQGVWDEVDVEIEGDDAAQQGIRYCLFQLLNTYRGGDPHLNIGAKGLTGEVYDGRAFWDTESYCVPFYVYTNPAAARRLLEFRHNTLDAARARAAELRYRGAIYPFTTIDGTEDCVVWDLAFSELHINAIIPFAIYQYARATGDEAYLFDKGAEVLIEQARFWADRAKFIPWRGGYGINRVTGPDEWHIWTNNNFYTNYMARWTLDYAASVIERMRQRSPDALTAVAGRTNLDEAEPLQWRITAEKMLLPFEEKLGIFPQDDLFLSLDPFSREQLVPGRDVPLERHWTVEKWYKHDLVKQPDTLLAIYFHREKFSMEEKRSNYRFYEQRTAHGSSLSPCIHSILAAEIGRYEQAAAYYLWASRLDLDDLNLSAHEGLHISSMAGTWQNIVLGFGGMIPTDEALQFNPILPGSWRGYAFRVTWRDSVLEVRVDAQQSHFRVLQGDSITIRVRDREATISSKVQSFPLDEKYLRRPRLEAAILDLDGVVVDTARFHYVAWKKLADREGIPFDERINERLKGVSRTESLRIIMEKSTRSYSEIELETLAQEKNADYVAMLEQLGAGDLLPGVAAFLDQLRRGGIRIALCSASKNSLHILEKLGVRHYFDAVITGNDVKRSKPDPEGMLLAAKQLGIAPENCVVVEDAQAGIAAARAAGMKTLGIGHKIDLHEADYTITDPRFLDVEKLRMLF
jgi:beta-phosphoglucomutase